MLTSEDVKADMPLRRSNSETLSKRQNHPKASTSSFHPFLLPERLELLLTAILGKTFEEEKH
jgi:hypothetical protein